MTRSYTVSSVERRIANLEALKRDALRRLATAEDYLAIVDSDGMASVLATITALESEVDSLDSALASLEGDLCAAECAEDAIDAA